jgi:hypothetical protein
MAQKMLPSSNACSYCVHIQATYKSRGAWFSLLQYTKTGKILPNDTKSTKWPQNLPNNHKIYQMTDNIPTKWPQTIPNDYKLYQTTTKNTKCPSNFSIFSIPRFSRIFPKLDFCDTIWHPWFRRRWREFVRKALNARGALSDRRHFFGEKKVMSHAALLLLMLTVKWYWNNTMLSFVSKIHTIFVGRGWRKWISCKNRNSRSKKNL